MNVYETISTDIVVIGGGAAGCYAAIEAYKAGANVALIVKGKIGHSGCTINVKTSAAVGFLSTTNDNSLAASIDLIKAGGYLGDQELIKLFIEGSFPIVKELIEWGISIEKDKKEFPLIKQYPSHTYPRNFSFTEETVFKNEDSSTAGRAIMSVLNKKIEQSQIATYENTSLVDLLSNNRDNSVNGVLAYNNVTGKYLVFSSKAVILATGTFSNIYSKTKSSSFDTGDGQAVAYQNEVELVDMEAVQFDSLSIRIPPGIKLYNSNKEEFIESYGIKDPSESMKEPLTYAVSCEMKNNKGYVYADLRNSFLSKSKPVWLDNYASTYKSMYKKDLRTDIIKTKPIAHATFGGIVIDKFCSTRKKGLFAAGSVVGGLYGFSRPKGYTSMIALFFGKSAGKNASEYIVGKDLDFLSSTYIKHKIQNSRKYFSNEGLTPQAIKYKLNQVMDAHAWVLRDGETLKNGLRKIEDLKEKIRHTKIKLEDKNSTLAAYEVNNLLVLSKLHLISSLLREESRGSFFRKDYPSLSRNWEKNIIVKKNGYDPNIYYKEPVMLYCSS